MNLKKAVRKFSVSASLTIILSLVFCPIGSMAASYTTTSTYHLDTGKIEVTSTVNGVTASEEVTYIAYRGAPTPANVVYVDQSPADGTSKAFHYFTDKTNVNAIVKFGHANAGAITPIGSDDDNILADKVPVTITPDGNGIVNGTVSGSSFTDGILAKASMLSFTPNYGYKATLGGVDAVSNNYTFDGTISSPLVIGFVPHGNFDIVNGIMQVDLRPTTPQADKFISTFGNVVISGNDPTVEYGILFSTVDHENLADFEADDADVTMFKALGKGTDGTFAVKLIDDRARVIKSDSTYYTRTYIKYKVNDNDVYEYGAKNTIAAGSSIGGV